MSACIEVNQNPNGSWTAKGSYRGVYAEVTCVNRHAAVTALTKALHAFELGEKP